MRVLGLMSGTSADGVDAALAQFKGRPDAPDWALLSTASVPYPAELKERLVHVAQGEPISASHLLEMSVAVTEMQAKAAQLCDPQRSASLVGCHGQTIWHAPPPPQNDRSDGVLRRGASWQMLQAPLLAHLVGHPVVHDFRAADLVLGGQGAPLVPMADAALMGRIDGWRGLLNLGGIANITLIPPKAGPDRQNPVLGWDCGPANPLMDLTAARLGAGGAAARTRWDRRPWPRYCVGGRHRAEATLEPHDHVSLSLAHLTSEPPSGARARVCSGAGHQLLRDS